MKVLICIELFEEPSVSYAKEIINWAKENIKDLVSFDLDNFSDQYMFKYAMELIEKEEKIVVMLDVKGKAQAGKLMGITEKIIRHKDKCMVIMNGENEMLEKMFGLLGERFNKEGIENNQKKIISRFLNG
jgi:hypothetical protein